MTEINSLENKIIKMEAKIDGLCEKFDTYHEDNKEQHEKIGVAIEKLSEKKADKEVVDEIRADIKRMGWLVISAVVITVLASIGLKAL